METSELLKRVRQVEIKTRGLSNHIFAGQYHSAFKGRGMTFAEVREYEYGDDVRNIDWNVTARFHKPHVKLFEEERELTVMLLVDVSGSGRFGTRVKMKKDLMTEIAATLAFSTIQNNDKVGVVFFSDEIEKYIPPQKGRKHVLHIIRELLSFEAKSKGTDLSKALQFFTNIQKKRSTAFVISDFLSKGFDDALMVASRKHDLIALRVYDEMERELPEVGLLRLKDSETGEETWVDTDDSKVRLQFRNWWAEESEELQRLFIKNGIDNIEIGTGDDYVRAMIQLFKMRN